MSGYEETQPTYSHSVAHNVTHTCVAHSVSVTDSVTDSTPRRPRPPPNRRRDKPQLSCNLCRRRKLRCDRLRPCSTCEKRGLESSCAYAVNSATLIPPTSARDRLRHLEDLVVSYMNQNEGTATSISTQSSPSVEGLDVSPAPPDVGSLKSSGTETKYQDQTHWNSILHAISELKEDFSELDNLEDSQPAPGSPEYSSINSLDFPLLYGCRHCSKEEILAALPSRDLADGLVTQCFELLELSSCALNKREFLKQYVSFWENPQGVPIMWLGLLFSTLSIAINFREFDTEQLRCGPQLDYISLSTSYREKTVQCLMLGQYTRCGPYVIETLLHYFAAEFMRRRDVNNEAWIILSTTVHLAMRMGYHRDPDHFKSISPYEGEMRRRVWAMLYHLGTTAGQLGVPRLINDTFVDTAEPRNLLDSDFELSSAELPPSRSDNEPTPILVVLAKLRAGRVYTAVATVATSAQPPTYAQILQVDQQLEDVFQKIPEYCRMQPRTDSLVDPPQVLLQRIFIQMNHHKAQIILHWRYLALANKDGRYSYSTRVTVSAALKILNLLQSIHEGLKTGGRLYSFRWRVTCFFSHDHLLAISILCFYLQRNGDTIGECELGEIKKTLRQSRHTWDSRIPISTEVKQAAAAIEAILPGIFGEDLDQNPSEDQALTPADSYGNSSLNGFSNTQDPFVGSMSPFFDPMFEGAPMFPSHINDMGAFIDLVLGGSIDPWGEPPNLVSLL
ncbi:putative fungal specific transcription factor domain-containing protein [Rosellinia necatrix]|uniref:Putative fungal specific transcription factor domain-containing protein n=1 Tax=Rosellinia necatrix TaxID=77044 RepID=A0A1S7UK75_ROSNE|nr:putative fungal specific transcription factor domain-containing protein [Rosellinia necatrix]